ncbi:MAG TPA: DUF2892 domain-containing protein [Gemmatimonadota bacterium]|nr:DUF2892 domain-containing protein [Gemmatimonadota bacterium]
MSRFLEMRKLGTIDRIARVAIGSGLLALIGKTDRFDLWTLGGAVAGTALLLTALVGSCMLYSLLGMRTSNSVRRGG